MNRLNRLRLYRFLKEEYKKEVLLQIYGAQPDYRFTAGICDFIRFLKIEKVDFLKELYEQGETFYSSYWWPKGDVRARLKALRQAISLTESRLNWIEKILYKIKPIKRYGKHQD